MARERGRLRRRLMVDSDAPLARVLRDRTLRRRRLLLAELLAPPIAFRPGGHQDLSSKPQES